MTLAPREEIRVADQSRHALLIFGQRARTREGKLQIEHAQLKYLLPRLTRFWSHLSRQRGSTGSIGGEGESQLEADRRKISERIEKISSELDNVRRQRETQRAGRQRSHWPLASIVGYTNAGKSTLLNRLTGAAERLLSELTMNRTDVIIVPVRMASLVQRRDAERWLQIARSMALPGKRRLVVEITDLSRDTARTRMTDLVMLISSLCRAVVQRVVELHEVELLGAKSS